MLKIILLFLTCLFIFHEPSAEKTAMNFVQYRYFNPVKAFELTDKKNTQLEFMRKHEQMLRIKDYELHDIIKFKVKKSSIINKNTIEVIVQVKRPHIQKIFSGFYLEKINKSIQSHNQIKKIIKSKLSDPNAPTETIDYPILLVKENSTWKIVNY